MTYEFVIQQISEEVNRPVAEMDLIRDIVRDSLDLICFVEALEGRLNLDIPNEEVIKLHTVGDIVGYATSRTV